MQYTSLHYEVCFNTVLQIPSVHGQADMNRRAFKPRGELPVSPADTELRAFLRKLFSSMPISRAQLADALSERLKEPVSLSRLEQFAASTKISARLPAYFLTAIAEVLNSDEILLHLARPCIRKQLE